MDSQSGIRMLNVSHNQVCLSPDQDKVGGSLKRGVLSQLEDIPKGTFPKLFELHTIDFSHNNLSSLGRSSFTQLFSLRHLVRDHHLFARLYLL